MGPTRRPTRVHPQITNVAGAADMLTLSSRTVLRHASNGMPCAKVGRSFRFWVPALSAWSHGVSYTAADAARDDQWSDAIALSIQEAAQALAVTDETVRALLKSGDLPGRQIGRYWRVSWPPLRDRIAGIG